MGRGFEPRWGHPDNASPRIACSPPLGALARCIRTSTSTKQTLNLKLYFN